MRRDKVAVILDGARRAFRAHGYASTSMDAVVRHSGVSKATLYKYFPDKRALFHAFVQDECVRQASHVFTLDAEDSDDVDATLRRAAHSVVRFLVSDEAIEIFRMTVAESANQPEVGRTFYAAGPAVGISRLAAYLGRMTEKGLLTVPDPEMAAQQLAELCKAGPYYHRLLNLETAVDEAEATRVADAAVDMFLRAYAPRRPDDHPDQR